MKAVGGSALRAVGVGAAVCWLAACSSERPPAAVVEPPPGPLPEVAAEHAAVESAAVVTPVAGPDVSDGRLARWAVTERGVDPGCDTWQAAEVPAPGTPFKANVEDDAFSAIAANERFVAWASRARGLSVLDLQRKRRRRLGTDYLSATASLDVDGSVLAYGALRCEPECEHSVVLIDLATCAYVRFGPRKTPENGQPPVYRGVTLDGDRLAWTETATSEGLTTVMLADLNVGTSRAVSTPSVFAHDPSLAGDWVVFREQPNRGSFIRNIHVVNLVTDERLVLTTGDLDKFSPRTNGRWVVWSEQTVAGDDVHGEDDIRGYDLQQRKPLTLVQGPGMQGLPWLFADRVVWTDLRDGRWAPGRRGVESAEIRELRLEPGATERIVVPLSFAPGVSKGAGRTLVWQDQRSEFYDVWVLQEP